MRCCNWLYVIGNNKSGIFCQHQQQEEDWSERIRPHQLHPPPSHLPSTLWYIIINIIKRLPSSPRPIYTSLCSSAFTTLPEILLITIDCLIYWQRIKLPRWRSLLYEGYSYHLDVYQLLISIYYLHQIATLLALASNRQRGDDWHILCPSSTSLKHSMDAPRKWGHP